MVEDLSAETEMNKGARMDEADNEQNRAGRG